MAALYRLPGRCCPIGIPLRAYWYEDSAMTCHPPALTRVFSELMEEVRTQTIPPPVESRVDTRFYSDPAWFEKERKALFDGQQPLLVGHTSMLKRAGDHFTHDHTGQPLLVVRDRDGEIR